MNKGLFKYGREIIERLNSFNYSAFFVGGCVRDLLLKRSIDDIDIATDAPAEEVNAIFPKTIPVGIDHGTVIVRHRGKSFEVTTFRQEDANVNEQSLNELLINDLKLRDFTINAMAMKKDGTIVDPFLGQKHLRKRIIKGVYNDYERLVEDPLRILRAFRFVSELGFTIDPNTLKQITIVNKQLESVAIERINQEFTKLVKGKDVKQAFQYMIKAQTVEYLPVLQEHSKLMIKLQGNIQPLSSLSEFFSLLNFLDDHLSIKRMTKEWKSSRRIEKEAKVLYDALCEYDKNGLSRWLVYRLTEQRFSSFVRLLNILDELTEITDEHLLTIYKQVPIQSKKEIPFTGEDLLKMFPHFRQGLWIKKKLLEIEQLIVNGRLTNNFAQIKEWVQCHPPDVD